MKLVWLFKEYRDLVLLQYDTMASCNQLNEQRRRQDIEHADELETVHKIYKLQIKDLEAQLAARSTAATSLEELAHSMFQEEPFENGRIPDDVWLTPGNPDRATK